MAQPIPLLIEHLVALNTDFQVLVCLYDECQHAVSPGALVRHFYLQHKTSIHLRKALEQYIHEFPSSYDYTTVQLPQDGSSPQPHLEVLTGYACRACKFKSQNRRTIRQHINKEHGKQRERDEAIFRVVRLQTWFKGKKERYWEVNEGLERAEEPAEPTQEGSQEATQEEGQVSYEQIESEIQEWKIASQERRLTLLSRPPAVELDPWIRYTKWFEVLAKSKHDLVRTYEFIRLPDPEEDGLQYVVRAWRQVKERCLDTLEATDHKDVLKWWASPQKDQASQRPFELPQNAQSLDKYNMLWEQFLCYLLRTTPRQWGQETETGIRLTRAQWESVQQIRELVRDLDSRPPQVIGDISGGRDTWSSSNESSDSEESRGPSYEHVQGEFDPGLVSEVMNLSQLVLTQDTSRISLYESPLMHYLAVRGIDLKAKALRTSISYTPVLAGVLWVARLVLLEVAVPQEAWPEIGLKSKAQLPSISWRVRTIREKHLIEGSFSPVSSVLTQLAMGKRYNQVHDRPSNIHWAEDSQTIFYKGMPVALIQVYTMGQALLGELQEILLDLAFQVDLPQLPLGQLVDSMAWTSELRQTAYSFLDHGQNPESLRVGHQFLLAEAKKPGSPWNLLDTRSYEAKWRTKVKHQYLVRERQFLSKLMVALHIMGGQPARGPELGSIKTSNSIYSARNIYIINGRACFLTTYDKSQKRRGNSDHIIRYLPDQLSQLLTQYLVFVRPFARVLDQRESEWLFGDSQGPWAGDQLSQALAKATAKHLGARLTISAWRHVAIGIAVRHLTQAHKIWEDDTQPGDEEGEEEESTELNENLQGHVLVRQASHGQRVAQAHYAIDGGFLHRLGPQLISAFEQASLAWHQLFGWASLGSRTNSHEKHSHRREASQQIGPAVSKKGRSDAVQEGRSHDNNKRVVRPEDRALAGLQQIYGPKAQFQSEGQAQAMALVHEPPLSSIIVLPTSSGKSALFFSVAALAVRQTVIVVVPFVALIRDLLARGQEAGLDCEIWCGQQSGKELRQLVIVSADMAVRTTFLHWAKGLELNGQLAHLFFDEGHVALTDTSYRTRLRELWRLRYLQCSFTVLTATLMVQLEGRLREQLLLPDAVLFRRPTIRPTIQYQVVDCGDESAALAGSRLIQGIQLALGQRGVVYVRDYFTGELVRERLGCPFYKALAESKSEVLDAWVHGQGGWIVATGALGTGINIPGISYVVHIDYPYGLTSFIQQSGRGGRGGETSGSIVVLPLARVSQWAAPLRGSGYTIEQLDSEALTEFVRSPDCRRRVLGKYFDGLADGGPSCIEGQWARCDNCLLGLRTIGPSEAGGPSRIQERLYEQEIRVEQIHQVMRLLGRSCVFCRLIYGPQNCDGVLEHSYDECVEAQEDGASIKEFFVWRKQVRLSEKVCWQCGFGRMFCRGPNEVSECEYPDIVFPGVFILYKIGYLIDIIRDLGFSGSYEEGFWVWAIKIELGGSGRWESNWERTWEVICLQYFKYYLEVSK
jgi:superfamily II DNA helicase RecQ